MLIKKKSCWEEVLINHTVDEDSLVTLSMNLL